MAGKADKELTCISLTCHSSGPIYVTRVESTLFYGSLNHVGPHVLKDRSEDLRNKYLVYIIPAFFAVNTY